jgi:hypothetical protein
LASNRETTQPSLAHLADWAAGLSLVYLEGALDRALSLAEAPPLISELAQAEYEALDEAARSEVAAEIEHAAAKIDEAAADIARARAEGLRQERLSSEQAQAALEEAESTQAATVYEQAAELARDEAHAAKHRRQSAEAALKRPRGERTSKSKKR